MFPLILDTPSFDYWLYSSANVALPSSTATAISVLPAVTGAVYNPIFVGSTGVAATVTLGPSGQELTPVLV